MSDQSKAHEPKQDELARAELLNQGTNGLLLVNGGGAVALVAFLQEVWNGASEGMRKWIIAAVACMAVGVVFGLAVTLFRFALSIAFWRNERSPDPKDQKAIRRCARGWRLCYCASIAMFVLAVGLLVGQAWRWSSHVTGPTTRASPP